MGSRGRSIRLRIYFLVAIPLVTLLALFADVAITSITNVVNLNRAPSLIKATSVPMATFMSTLEAERRAAVVYASNPTSGNLADYTSAIAATTSVDPSPAADHPHGIGFLQVAVNDPKTK